VGSGELGVGSWELGVGSWELGAGRDLKLRFTTAYSLSTIHYSLFTPLPPIPYLAA
jgi:hypothetical protein